MIFSSRVHGRELRFFALHLVHHEAYFELSKSLFEQNLRQTLNVIKNVLEKLFWNQHDKANTKQVVEVP